MVRLSKVDTLIPVSAHVPRRILLNINIYVCDMSSLTQYLVHQNREWWPCFL